MAKPDEVSSSRDEILHNVLQTTLIIPGKPKGMMMRDMLLLSITMLSGLVT